MDDRPGTSESLLIITNITHFYIYNSLLRTITHCCVMMHNDRVEMMCKHVALLAELILMRGSGGGMSTICETQELALRR